MTKGEEVVILDTGICDGITPTSQQMGTIQLLISKGLMESAKGTHNRYFLTSTGSQIKRVLVRNKRRRHHEQ